MDSTNATPPDPDFLEELDLELTPELEPQYREQLAILTKIEVTTARAAAEAAASCSKKKIHNTSKTSKIRLNSKYVSKNSERYVPQFKKKVLDYLNEQSPNTTAHCKEPLPDIDNWDSICGVFKRKPKPIKDVKFKKLSHFPNSISKAAQKFDVHATTISDWVYDTKRQVEIKGLEQKHIQIQTNNNPVINLDELLHVKTDGENVLEKELIDWLQHQRLQLALIQGKQKRTILEDLKIELETHVDYLLDKYEKQNYGNNYESDAWVLEWCIKFKRDVEKAKESALNEDEDLSLDNEDLEDLSDLELATSHINVQGNWAISQVSKRIHCQFKIMNSSSQQDKDSVLSDFGKRASRLNRNIRNKRGKGSLVTKAQIRKATRKQKRKDKKAGKHQFLVAKCEKSKSLSKNPKNQNKKNSQLTPVVRSEGTAGPGVKQKPPQAKSHEIKGKKTIRKPLDSASLLKKEEETLKKEMEDVRLKRLIEDNEKEDRYINQLHKKLKLNKKAAIPASFRTDGLDYLLEICDKGKSSKKKIKADDSDPESDDDKEQESGMDSDSADFQSDQSDSEEEVPNTDQRKGKKNKNRDEDGGSEESDEFDDEDIESEFSDNEDDSGSDNNSEQDEEAIPDEIIAKPKSKKKKDEFWEDIYGRLRDKSGAVIDSKTLKTENVAPENKPSLGKYVPPMKRTNDSKRDKILKALKGLLNRLSEGNMHRIAQQVEELYMSNSRNEMNESMLEILNSSLVQSASQSDRIILEHIMLIAILHANVGTEVGAFFIQNFVQLFRSKYDETEDLEDNKEIQNLILLISFTYHFKIVDCVLMYDILNFLADKFTPKDVELILTILRSVGFRLRKDDPVALKALILLLQQKATTATLGVLSSRVKFMLEILMAIRNNNMNKIPNYDPSFGEHLLKILKVHLSKGNYISEMKISMKDLLNAETKGRWWIVGSAWTNEESASTDKNDDAIIAKTKFNEELMAKAKSQGMNTEIRQNIFCILMTAEDYLDAFEKLSRLGLKNQMEREIIFVIVYCCLQEAKYNPYYSLIAAKFCSFDRKYMLSLQYTLWDRLKDLENQPPQQRKNMAKMIGYMIKECVLPVSILKVIEFADMDKIKLKFLKSVFSIVLLETEEATLQEIFSKVSLSEKLSFFKESLRLFIGHFMLAPNVETSSGKSIVSKLDPTKLEILRSRVKIAEKSLSMGKGRVLL